MGAIDKIKNVGIGIGGLVAMLIMVAIPIIFLFGMTRVSMNVLPWLMPAFFWTLAVCVFLLGPLALLLTFDLWGMFAVVIGILFLGVGIVPVALLAVIFHAEWSSLGDLAIMIVSTFGFRILAVWLGEKARRESQGIYG